MSLLAPFIARVKAGGVLTFVGEAPGQAVYWSVLAQDPREGYGPWPAVGSLLRTHGKTDAASRATNAWYGPPHTPKIRVGMGYKVGEVVVGQPSGLWDRVYVKIATGDAGRRPPQPPQGI